MAEPARRPSTPAGGGSRSEGGLAERLPAPSRPRLYADALPATAWSPPATRSWRRSRALQLVFLLVAVGAIVAVALSVPA